MTVAVVTGASQGIGQATAIALARQGADVVGTYRPEAGEDERAQARETVAAVEALGRRCILIEADAAQAASARSTAELAVMGAGQAAAILMRRATPEEKTAFEDDYSARLLNPYVAAERGYVDAVIDPASTRAAVADAIEMLSAKREVLVARKHDNTPL